MKDGISGAALPAGFPYKPIIEKVCFENDCSPCLVAAIKMNETGLDDPPDIVSGDGGHGLMQLTSSYPSNWADPYANFQYAVQNYITPAWAFWVGEGLQGGDLVRAIAAEYNAGRGGAEEGHAEGDIGKYTTDHYDQRCLSNYLALIGGTIPS